MNVPSENPKRLEKISLLLIEMAEDYKNFAYEGKWQVCNSSQSVFDFCVLILAHNAILQYYVIQRYKNKFMSDPYHIAR